MTLKPPPNPIDKLSELSPAWPGLAGRRETKRRSGAAGQGPASAPLDR